MNKIQITPKYADVKPEGYYVYVHRRATNLSPFYVGKGKGNRAWEKTKSSCRSDHWINCAHKNDVVVEIIKDGLDEFSAYAMEADVICNYRSIGYDLVNKSEGGIGPTGQIVSQETRDKISNAFQFPVWNDDGEKFHNVMAAARVMRVRGYPKAASSGIVAAIRGVKSKTAYGYAWSRDCIPNKPIATGYEASNINSRIPVLCIDTGDKFVSCSDAARWIISRGRKNASSCRISSCAKGDTMSAYGMKWRYLK